MRIFISLLVVGMALFSLPGKTAGRGGRVYADAGSSSVSGGSHLQELVLSGTEGGISFSGGNSLLSIKTMYGYFVVPRVEVAGEFGMLNSSGGGTEISLFAHGIYNFSDNYADAFFAFGAFGINSYSRKGSSTSNSGMKFGGGKRFPIWGNVGLLAKFWLQKDGSEDMVTHIFPLNFSILF